MENLSKIIHSLYPQDILEGNIVLRDDGGGAYIDKWGIADTIPSDDQLQLMYKDHLRSGDINKVDSIAYNKIINIAPEHTQRNMIARSTELLEKQLNMEELTAEEISERGYIRSVWERVKTIRAHAKYLKSEIEAGNNPDINVGWSE